MDFNEYYEIVLKALGENADALEALEGMWNEYQDMKGKAEF